MRGNLAGKVSEDGKYRECRNLAEAAPGGIVKDHPQLSNPILGVRTAPRVQESLELFQ